MPSGAWYEDSVQYAYENGLMNGVGGGRFNPSGTAPRAMVVTILHRMAGEPSSSQIIFNDVPLDAWYFDSICWAYDHDILTGYGNGSMGPNKPVTREQLMTILYAYAQQKDLGFTGNWMFQLDYADADAVSTWAYEAACWCTMENVVSGKSGNQLDPAGTATRAEAAQMLMNFSLVLDEA